MRSMVGLGEVMTGGGDRPGRSYPESASLPGATWQRGGWLFSNHGFLNVDHKRSDDVAFAKIAPCSYHDRFNFESEGLDERANEFNLCKGKCRAACA